MCRILIHVEGQTEETFVNEVLVPHLAIINPRAVVSARLMGNPRQLGRGGVVNWPAMKRDLLRHLKADQGCLQTTMVDYYAMPKSGMKAWPGRGLVNAKSFIGKAVAVEDGMKAAILEELGANFKSHLFVPFVLMHEFEALLFSDCAAFSQGIGQPELQCDLQAIRDSFSSPEEINDSRETAPSKRIANLVRGYEKPLSGSIGIIAIGLDTVRAECPHFDAWLTQLEDWVRQ